MKLLKKDIFIAVMLVIVLIIFSVHKVGIMRRRAFAAITQNNLSAINDAIAVYRGDHEGKCPRSLEVLTPDYLPQIPDHMELDGDRVSVHKTGKRVDMDGQGGWLFIKDPKDTENCRVVLNSTENLS